MKKTLTFFLFFTLVLSIFFVFLPHDTVKATSTFSTVIENFDSYAEGVTTGTNSYLTWKTTGSIFFATSTTNKYSSPNAIREYGTVNPAHSYLYLNLSTSMEINSFSYKFNISISDSGTTDYVYLINSSGKVFIGFAIRYDSIKVYDMGSWAYLWNNEGGGWLNQCLKWLEIGFQGNHTSTNPLNYVYYYVKVGGVINAQIEKRWNSTSEFTTQDLSRILYDDYHSSGSVPYFFGNIDDFTIGYGSFVGSGGFSYDEGYIIRCMNDGSTACTDTFELLSDCSIDWGCGILSYFYLEDLQDCSDCAVTYNPTRYVEYKTQYQYNEIIHDVFLPIGLGQYNYVSNNPSDYSMTINGIDCGVADYIIPYGFEYAIVWKSVDKKIDDDYVLFSFKSDKTTVGYGRNAYWLELFYTFGGGGTTKTHNDLTAYLNNQLGGQDWGNLELYLCWSFNESTIVDPYTTNIDETIILNYYDNYFLTGDNNSGYMEFSNFEQLCGYTVGQSPDIYFNLTGYNNSKIKYYAYQIYYQSGTSGIFVEDGIIEVLGQYRKGVIHSSYTFLNTGKYYIMVYNATSDGMTLLDFVHRSESVGVCDTVTPPIARTTEIDYNWIFALCIIMGCIIAPVIIFRNNQFFINNGTIVVALFGIIGLGICINFGFVELWFSYLVALIIVGILFIKIYQIVEEGRGK